MKNVIINRNQDSEITFSKRSHILAEQFDTNAEVSFGVGTHIYCELRLAHGLTSSNVSDDRERGLRAMAEFGIQAAQVAHRFGGQLLEHQGRRVHLWLQGDNQELSTAEAYLCTQLLDERVREKVKPIAAKSFQGHVGACSWGSTVFITNKDLHGDQSTISVSHAANAPAKALSQLVDKEIVVVNGVSQRYSERLELNESIYNRAVGEMQKNASNYEPNAIRAYYSERAKSASVDFSAIDEENIGSNNVHMHWGYTMRADLDGFTNAVIRAEHDDDQLKVLVGGLIQLMDDAAEFAKNHTSNFIQPSWAGDCYTLIAINECPDTYREAQKKDLVELCIDFEDEMKDSVLIRHAGIEGWAFSVAGGNINPQQSGNVMVTRLHLGEQSFVLSSGKCIRRSLDAHEQLDIHVGEVALFTEDKPPLVEYYKREFSNMNTNFDGCEIDNLKRAKRVQGRTAPRATASIPAALPALNNWYCPHED